MTDILEKRVTRLEQRSVKQVIGIVPPTIIHAFAEKATDAGVLFMFVAPVSGVVKAMALRLQEPSPVSTTLQISHQGTLFTGWDVKVSTPKVVDSREYKVNAGDLIVVEDPDRVLKNVSVSLALFVDRSGSEKVKVLLGEE